MRPLVVRTTTRTLRLARHGRLVPWLGPALRGLAGGRLRARVCRLPVADQIGPRRNCAGCPVMAGCPYGETFEPDPPAGCPVMAGWENAARPLVVAPAFPVPTAGTPGFTFPVTVRLFGAAAAHAPAVWEAVRIGGADLALGLGEDHVPYDVFPADAPDADETVALPFEPGLPTIPLVRVTLTAPLFLSAAGPGGPKRPVLRPTFGDLVRAGLRALGPLHKLYAAPLPDPVFGAVKAAAEPVPTAAAGFREFGQTRWSNRTKQRFDVAGVTGWGEYGPVPGWLVPWLTWAGRAHVGTHRVAGAGGWRVEPG